MHAHMHPQAMHPQPPHPQPAAQGYAPGFVAHILDLARASGERVFAITGLQGTGKSTLSAQVAALAEQQGERVVALSIDDFYFGHEARQRLGREVHPLCATRGVPGSQDVALACEVIDALREGRPTPPCPASTRSPTTACRNRNGRWWSMPTWCCSKAGSSRCRRRIRQT